jgi:hypothetical protein
MSGDSDMIAMIAKLRALSEMPENAAPSVAAVVRESLRSTISAGTTAYGEPWELTKDGRQALRTAANNLRVTSIGHRVFAAVTGYIGRHNNGTSNGGVERRILPKSAIPRAMSARITRALADVFARLTAGAP